MRIDLLEKITKSGRLLGLRAAVVRHPREADLWTLAVPVRGGGSLREYVGCWASRRVAEQERREVRAACFHELVGRLARRASAMRAKGLRERAVRCTAAMMRCLRLANAETYQSVRVAGLRRAA